MGNEQKLIELQRDTVFTGYKPLILNDNETVTFSTNCTTTPGKVSLGDPAMGKVKPSAHLNGNGSGA